MALTDRLRSLDQKILPGTREPDEDAESYLRRVAAGRAISPAQAGDEMAALRQYLGVQEGEAGDESGDEESDEQQSDEPRDEASDESKDESNADESGSEDDSNADESGYEESGAEESESEESEDDE